MGDCARVGVLEGLCGSHEGHHAVAEGRRALRPVEESYAGNVQVVKVVAVFVKDGEIIYVQPDDRVFHPGA